MGNLKNNLSDSESLFNRYAGQIIVYLESSDDNNIYSNIWFGDRLMEFLFKPANKGAATYGGCQAVRESVNHDRTNGIKSFGIVDRDIVMADDHWYLVWETDNSRFAQAMPFGPYIKVLNRWELENYLVDSQAIEEYLANHIGRKPRSTQDVVKELLEHCDVLTLHAAGNAACHNERIKGFTDGFTNSNDKNWVDKDIQQRFQKYINCQQDYLINIAKVQAFDTPGTSNEERLDKLLRIICGKALLSRIKRQHNISHEIRFHLAAAIKRNKRVPLEISNHLDSFKTSS
ncbi:MAG: DUF4435 domain-containing protein [Candidatus Competibacter sp.]|nr:DUF4435 domain-containing protein [Candidatus Competibacter sp.]MDG4582500.1 DUF4435 domain-containing protein [Candidatus Competibacter sp.]